MNRIPGTQAQAQAPRTRLGGKVTLRGREYRSHAELEEALVEATHQAARDRENEPDRWPTAVTRPQDTEDAGTTRWKLTARGEALATQLAAQRTEGRR